MMDVPDKLRIPHGFGHLVIAQVQIPVEVDDRTNVTAGRLMRAPLRLVLSRIWAAYQGFPHVQDMPVPSHGSSAPSS
jgi:hypothetical protein